LEAFCVVRLNDTIAPWGSLLAPAALDCSTEALANCSPAFVRASPTPQRRRVSLLLLL